MGSARYHFSGIAGAGMHPLALVVRARGHEVQGSDRSFDRGDNADIEASLRRAGIAIEPQDGRAITADVDRLVFSAAVEADTPEIRAARALGIELLPRPALLAEIVNDGRPGVAVAGTSGKSTITGMLAWIVRCARIEATVIGGAALVGEGVGGCFVAGPADGPVIAEACESDGTLVGYRPAVALVHNISRDHGEVDALRLQFQTFADHGQRVLLNAGCPEAARLARGRRATTYGTTPDADARVEVGASRADRALGTLHAGGRAIALDVPQPGRHNLENAAAAALVALGLGVAPDVLARALSCFPGVARRFEVVGVTESGIRVVDDYAHNAEKLRAAITTAQAGARRIVALFQPHGFGPARFLRPELRELLPRLLRPHDRFAYAEIFYAGGTVTRDVSSRILADDLPAALRCEALPDHAAAVDWICGETRPGDTVLVMGARDPSLPRLARAAFSALAARAHASPRDAGKAEYVAGDHALLVGGDDPDRDSAARRRDARPVAPVGLGVDGDAQPRQV
jgi:UDP-N-acetylmuramate--alanine ligase